MSDTSTPFPDPEFYSSGGGSSKTLTAEGLVDCNIVPRSIFLVHSSILDGHISAVVPASDESPLSHRVSFELTTEEVAQRMEEKPAIPTEAGLGSSHDETESGRVSPVNDASHDLPEKLPTAGVLMVGKEFKFDDSEASKNSSPDKLPNSGELVASREFKFNNSDGATAEPSVDSDWWVNEKVVVADTVPPKKWAFFPMIQPGVG